MRFYTESARKFTFLASSLFFWGFFHLAGPACACGPIVYEFKGYSFLSPSLINLEGTLSLWMLESNPLFSKYQRTASEDKKQANLKEWQDRHCGQVTLEDLEQVIYRASPTELKSLDMAVRSESIPLPNEYRQNTFATFMEDEKCTETIEYLLYAKKCEPYLTGNQNAWSKQKPDVEAMNTLLQEGRKAFRSCHSHYLKRRYTYQILRLAHYSKQYDLVIELYETLIPKIDQQLPSILDGWMLSLKAGALRHSGNRVEAAYLFSKIFSDYPSIRTEAFRSFYLKNEEEWKQCMLRCGSNHERATLHVIRANAQYSKRVREMIAIYDLYPEHPDLPVLLVQDLLELEKDLLGTTFNSQRKTNATHFGIPRKKAQEKVIELHQFVGHVLQDGKIQDLSIWRIADGYLSLLAGDLYSAGQTFARILTQLDDENDRKQINTLQLVMQILQLDAIGPETEALAYRLRLQNPIFKSNGDFNALLSDKLAHLYYQSGNPGKAFRVQYDTEKLQYNPRLEVLNELLAISEKATKTAYERLLLQDKTGKDITSYLWYLKGIYFIGRYQLEAAAEAFKKIPATERPTYGLFDPFQFRYSECINCGIPESEKKYDLLELTETLLALEYEAKADPEKAAPNYFQLGLALYNISYFGYAWGAADAYRSGKNWLPKEGSIYPSWQAPEGNFEVKDCSKPLYYFELSRRIADYTDRELAARAAFMAARCRQKQYFSSSAFMYKPESKKIPAMPKTFTYYYDLLNQKYQDTDTYQRIFRECLYFQAYSIR